ncbi:MAG: helix-turn-helix domain-containing protein [Pirellulales bacterium]|nr:helix-turn-helix domain-containing protein [Pirellulales bacterium]
MSEHRYHYLPVSDFTMKWGAYVTGLGLAVYQPGDVYPPPAYHPQLYQFDWNRGRTLPEFQMLLITTGQGSFESLATGEIPIKANSAFFLFPGVWHRYRPGSSTGWTERWLSFNGEYFHRLMNLHVITPDNPVLNIPSPQPLVQRFDKLLEKINARPSRNSVLWSLSAMGLLAETMEQTEDDSFFSNLESGFEAPASDDPLVSKAVEMIWTYSHRILSVDKLTRQLRTPRRTLDRRFREVLGRTVLEEINRCRLTRAKRLLTETTLPMKTVAFLAGFTDAERMRVVFLNQEKVTPTDYRRSQQASGLKTFSP